MDSRRCWPWPIKRLDAMYAMIRAPNVCGPLDVVRLAKSFRRQRDDDSTA